MQKVGLGSSGLMAGMKKPIEFLLDFERYHSQLAGAVISLKR